MKLRRRQFLLAVLALIVAGSARGGSAEPEPDDDLTLFELEADLKPVGSSSLGSLR